MSTPISNHPLEPNVQYSETEDKNCFNELVLTYIKNNQPDGELAQLLNQMKDLSPETPNAKTQLCIIILRYNTAF